MTQTRTERSVLILELEFRDAMVGVAVILQTHGIDPHRPYTHEHTWVDGAPAHRYIQPPRPTPRPTATETGG